MPYQENVDHLTTIFPQGVPLEITVHVADNIDHTLHVVDRPCVPWNEAVKNPFSGELRNFLTGWLLEKIPSDGNTENDQ